MAGPGLHVDKLANLQTSRFVWVGGRLTVDDRTLEFHPNAPNRALNAGVLDVVVPLDEVERVELAGGFVTTKVRVVGRRGEVVVRCYGARGVVETLRRLTGAA